MIFVLALIAIMLVLFFWEILPIPITALLGAVALMAARVLTPEEGLSGFSSRATIAVLAMFVLSAGLQQTGAVYALTQKLVAWAGNSHGKQLAALAAATGPISGFVNNTPVVAVMIPACQQMAQRSGIAPSKLLMPVSTFAMLGGLLTVIGSSTNLLGNATLRRLGLEPFGFFDYTIVGVVALLTGLAYYLIFGRWFLPDRGAADLVSRFDLKGFFGEFLVTADSPAVGKTLREAGLSFSDGALAAQLRRRGETMDTPDPDMRLEIGDALLVETSREKMMRLREDEGLEPLPEVVHPLALEDSERVSAEVVITVASRYIGRTIADIDFRRRYQAHVLAMRHHARVETGRLSQNRLHAGDVLLIQASTESLERLREQPDLFLTRERPVTTYRADKRTAAIAIIVGVVLVSALGWVDIAVAALAGAIGMVMAGCLRIEEFWRSVHWDIIFLLAGVIPLGIALEKTGAAALLAGGLVDVSSNLPLTGFLIVIFLMTTLITEIVSNNASVVLLIPIVVAAAAAMGIDPRPAALAAILAASTSMLTPIGYQTNTMVYAPGSYRFGDFARVGAPLNFILAVVIPVTIAWRFA